ncbi:hypothetical protein ACWC4J_28215, partial [Streptomyces sp. NPDC001356]
EASRVRSRALRMWWFSGGLWKQGSMGAAFRLSAGTQVGYYDWSATDMLTVMGGRLQEVMAGRTSGADFTKAVQDAWLRARRTQ